MKYPAPTPTLKDPKDQVEVRKAFSDLCRVLEKKIVGEKTGSDPDRGLFVEYTEGPNAQELAEPGTIPIRDDNGALVGNITGNAPAATLAANSTLFGGKTPAEFVLDYIYPVGCYYTQYPDADSNTDSVEFPTTQRPAALFGGTWAEQWSGESVYFRTRGTLSDTGRTNGKQEDAFQGHRHKLNVSASGAGALTRIMYRGDASTTLDFTAFDGGVATDGVNGTPRIAAETRTVNRRIKVWKRTA